MPLQEEPVDQQFEVEAILKHTPEFTTAGAKVTRVFLSKVKNKGFYKVKWVGYGDSEATWEVAAGPTGLEEQVPETISKYWYNLRIQEGADVRRISSPYAVAKAPIKTDNTPSRSAIAAKSAPKVNYPSDSDSASLSGAENKKKELSNTPSKRKSRKPLGLIAASFEEPEVASETVIGAQLQTHSESVQSPPSSMIGDNVVPDAGKTAANGIVVREDARNGRPEQKDVSAAPTVPVAPTVGSKRAVPSKDDDFPEVKVYKTPEDDPLDKETTARIDQLKSECNLFKFYYLKNNQRKRWHLSLDKAQIVKFGTYKKRLGFQIKDMGCGKIVFLPVEDTKDSKRGQYLLKEKIEEFISTQLANKMAI